LPDLDVGSVGGSVAVDVERLAGGVFRRQLIATGDGVNAPALIRLADIGPKIDIANVSPVSVWRFNRYFPRFSVISIT
jgi:hypothetical protein